MAHVTAGICHNCRLYRVPLLKSEISFAEWIIYVCQMDTSLLSLHTTAFKLPLVLTTMSPRFILCIVVFRFLSLPFLRGLTVQQQQIVFWAKSSNRSGGKDVHTDCNQPPLHSSSYLSLCNWLLSGVVSSAFCPYPGTHPCHTYNQWSHIVCAFFCQNVCFFFFGKQCLKINLPLNFKVTSSTAICSEVL